MAGISLKDLGPRPAAKAWVGSTQMAVGVIAAYAMARLTGAEAPDPVTVGEAVAVLGGAAAAALGNFVSVWLARNRGAK